MDNYIKLTLVSLLILTDISCAQKVKNQTVSTDTADITYKNVIEITDKDVVADGKNFLFTRSISGKIDTPVVFVSTRVPLDLLRGIYPEFRRLTIIAPNWKYYAEIAEDPPVGEPIASSIIYQLNRENETVIKDSLIIMGDFPKMEFVRKSDAEKNILKVYYIESYGSKCCPRDPKWDLRPSLKEFELDFKTKNKVKIGGTYAEFVGKEGEVNYYYQFKGLSDTLKLKFIVDRVKLRPEIYTPTEVVLNDGMKLDEH